MRLAGLALIVFFGLGAGPAAAQQQTGRQQTLADIRQELTVLYVELQRLRRELSTTGAPVATVPGDTVLDRVAAIEAELQRLTAQTEQLEFRIERIVADGTNRIGDLEFRLVELEGGDIGQLGETTTLGGEDPALIGADDPANGQDAGAETPQGELAIGESTDFEAASKALADGDYAVAADLFGQFNQTYPGSPLAARANLGRGRALDGLGDTREAARAYLAGFTADASGPAAAEALYELGAALGRLEQTDQACVTLSEVGVRFPEDGAAARAREEMARLGCS